jgi:hypothetical protein
VIELIVNVWEALIESSLAMSRDKKTVMDAETPASARLAIAVTVETKLHKPYSSIPRNRIRRGIRRKLSPRRVTEPERL